MGIVSHADSSQLRGCSRDYAVGHGNLVFLSYLCGYYSELMVDRYDLEILLEQPHAQLGHLSPLFLERQTVDFMNDY